MDLRDTARAARFRGELRAWLAQQVPAFGPSPSPRAWEARRAYDTAWQRKLFEAGYAGIHWPPEYGGRGASAAEELVYHEETARAGAPYIGANFIGLMHAGPTLMVEGTLEQRERTLPRILRGEQIWCQGFSEPEAGSDLASLRTRAVRDGDHYVVSGQKIWSTRAQMADLCELLVRTDPEAPRHRGITWLMLPMDAAGIEIRPLQDLEGDLEFSQLFFEDVRVPVENRIGAENDGWRVANVTLRFERGTSYTARIANLQRLVALLRRVAEQSRRGGEPAWGDAGLRRELGELQARVDALWALLRLTVAESARSGVPSLAGSAVKLQFSELYQRLAELGVRLLGRAGLARQDLAELPCGDLLHEMIWSLTTTIAAGTSQIQRNILAERVLGLPR